MTAFYGETLGLPFVRRYGSRPGAELRPVAIMRTEEFGATFSAQRDADRSPSQRRSRRARAA
jgi:hypothetical protein